MKVWSTAEATPETLTDTLNQLEEQKETIFAVVQIVDAAFAIVSFHEGPAVQSETAREKHAAGMAAAAAATVTDSQR